MSKPLELKKKNGTLLAPEVSSIYEIDVFLPECLETIHHLVFLGDLGQHLGCHRSILRDSNHPFPLSKSLSISRMRIHFAMEP